MAEGGEIKLNLSMIEESDHVSEEDKMVKEEKEIIQKSCDHITNFIDELSKCKIEDMPEDSKQRIHETQKYLLKFLSLGGNNIESENKVVEEVKVKSLEGVKNKVYASQNSKKPFKPIFKNEMESSSSSNQEDVNEESESEVESKRLVQTKKKMKGKTEVKKKVEVEDKSFLEILAEKIDNRKVPVQGKYDEDSGESLQDYLKRFEKYSEDNVRGDAQFWIDELEERLTGETLKVFKATKDVGDTYQSLKEKLVLWYDDMKSMRKKKAKSLFEKSTYNSDDSLYLYSTKLEKFYKRAYPNSNVEKSCLLNEKYMKTIPRRTKEKLLEKQFNDKLNNVRTRWSSIQKFARYSDVWKETKVSDESDEKESTKEIFINVNTVESQTNSLAKKSNIQVEYDQNNKRFYISNPNLLNIKPPEVQFTYEGSRQRNQSDKPRFFHNSSTKNGDHDKNERNKNGDHYRRNYMAGDEGGKQTHHSRFSLPPRNNGKSCYRCGRMGHLISQCYARKPQTCYTCGQQGHISTNCRRRNQRTNSLPPQGRYSNNKFSNNNNDYDNRKYDYAGQSSRDHRSRYDKQKASNSQENRQNINENKHQRRNSSN